MLSGTMIFGNLIVPDLLRDHTKLHSLQHLPTLPHGLDQPLPNMFSHNSVYSRSVERFHFQLQITIQKERNAVSVPVADGADDPVPSTAVIPSRPFPHHVTHIDDERILFHWDRDPRFSSVDTKPRDPRCLAAVAGLPLRQSPCGHRL